jgi:uncharacterized membrane protein
VLVIAAAVLAAARRSGSVRPPFLTQVVILVLFAAWLGAGYRVATAGVIGANIGGGLFLLVTPVVAVVAFVSVAALAVRAGRNP